MPTVRKKLRVLDTLSNKVVADAARALSNKALATALRAVPANEVQDLIAAAMGLALRRGEVTIPDGVDIPPKARRENLERIRKIRDPRVRAEFLAGKGTPTHSKPKASSKKA